MQGRVPLAKPLPQIVARLCQSENLSITSDQRKRPRINGKVEVRRIGGVRWEVEDFWNPFNINGGAVQMVEERLYPLGRD